MDLSRRATRFAVPIDSVASSAPVHAVYDGPYGVRGQVADARNGTAVAGALVQLGAIGFGGDITLNPALADHADAEGRYAIAVEDAAVARLPFRLERIDGFGPRFHHGLVQDRFRPRLDGSFSTSGLSPGHGRLSTRGSTGSFSSTRIDDATTYVHGESAAGQPRGTPITVDGQDDTVIAFTPDRGPMFRDACE